MIKTPAQVQKIETNQEKKRLSWLASDNTITVNLDGETHMLARTDAYSEKLIAALKAKDFDVIPTLISAAKRIEKFSDGKFKVIDGKILVDGVEAPTALGNKIKQFADEGLPYIPLVRFAQKLNLNPSNKSVNSLFSFIEKNDIMIAENGNIVLYKKVRSDFKDCHSGTYDNSVGNIVKMPRNKVEDDPNKGCSAGLHVANFNYAKVFQDGIMLEVEVNPKDVVSVPYECSLAKMRVCEYKVLRVVNKENTDILYDPKKYEDVDPNEEIDYNEYCDGCGEDFDFCICDDEDNY